MKKSLFLLALFCISQIILSQNEASNWYFGQRAGLNFNAANGTVTALTDGQLNTLEGCTSISDTDGNLLFYSDGRTVWNSLHQPMANASEALGTGLKGDDSSTSSGLIVPKPQDPNFYYIFTVDEPHHFNSAAFPDQVDGDGINDGLMYSLVDINLNAGLGDVDPLEKNIQLITYDVTNPAEVDFKCSEKITAVKADDCSSFWVISHFTNKFYAFKVDVNGVNTTPVISIVGPEVPVSGYRRNALGYIKASPDGSRLVVAHLGFATTLAGEAPGGVYLFDFDNDTGIVSNEQVLYGPENGDSPYGVEFSAENRKIYATVNAGANGSGPSSVIQWDLESADIPASQTVIHTSNTFTAGALQLGINRKIYRAQVNLNNPNATARFLGVIENAEADGTAANYNETGILVDVNGGFQNLSRIGLPPFIQSLFNSQIDIIQNGISTTELKLCVGDSYTLTAIDVPGGTYTWSKDGVPLAETSFQLFVDEPGFYEVYIEPNNGECPIEGEAIVGIFDIPVANQPNNLTVCDVTTTSAFDFTTQNTDVLGAQNPAEFEVLYFTTLDDANVNQNNIIGTFNNTENPQEIFARVQNINNPNCFDVTSFFVEVFVTPIITTLDDVTVCDIDFGGNVTDGISTVDLSELYADILGAQDANLYTISFHTNQQDADDDVNALAENFTNTTAFTQTIFVRIENNLNTDCYSTDSFNLTINEAPTANSVSLIQCDEDGIPEGFTTFNFNQVTDDITGGATDRTLTYYLSYDNALNDVNAIDGNAFENFFNPQTIFVRVENDITNCYNISELTLEVSLTSSNNASLEACDDDGTEDGFYSFDLSTTNTTVLNTLPANLDVVYYETYENALLEVNPLGNTFINTIPYNQTIYARVENSNACYGISEIELTVFELPNIDIEDETLYCLNFFPETITLTGGVIDDSPSNYYYLWSTGENTSEIMVNAPGTYTVRVTNTNGCFKDRTVTVLPSNIATITDINVVDASQNNSVTVIVSGEGDYEYAIDNINGPYQDSNTFENVAPGLHTVFVRDKNECGIVDSLVSVIGFPKFFTPNNDGYFDYWQVYGITPEFQSQSTIYIFDRYGKLLKELDPLSIGWDGTYNGYRLPSSDYWFSVRLEDGRTFKSHFALKR
jgi:gliding motility-associated-like protein